MLTRSKDPYGQGFREVEVEYPTEYKTTFERTQPKQKEAPKSKGWLEWYLQ